MNNESDELERRARVLSERCLVPFEFAKRHIQRLGERALTTSQHVERFEKGGVR